MPAADAIEHVDVLIVGAGLSGIGAGYHLQSACPEKSYAILEARDGIGGTWDLFRYPGIRSDSDMYTLGYAFRPWTEPEAIAGGPAILAYVRDTAREYGIDEHVRYRHRVVRAEFSSAQARWTVDVERGEERETVTLTCGFLFVCSGYYRYDEGYTPDFAGTERFTGEIVHPQHWRSDVDYEGKRVVVIGSGATAVTLVPALAERAEHVTMLQRSPSYIVSLPAEDPLARLLRRLLPTRASYPIVRWKNVLLTMLSFQLSRRRPELMKALIRKGIARELPPGFDVERHFNPTYNPWDQRLCLVPGGDLFQAIGAGRASVLTDEIDAFTETGLALASGAELEAELVVTATGLNLLALGGMEIAVDGRTVELPETMSYRGMMLSGVPNLAIALGYTNASWTLKSDLTCAYVCRLLNHMDRHRYLQCVPRRDPSVGEQPFIDFTSGYVLRSIDKFPKQGTKAPWRLYQNYPRDILNLKFGALDDGAMEFSGVSAASGATARRAARTR
ncbi:MAG TPA: NAD(P)/FAD-dependent oxidoreductase [Solirubrobacteraceae bacterium]|jgi:cation diffusion facilitator CzcD-associated flavoprotein CzcO|nr:NAD(P)/FAD-dependent oxidoreductase [Solirubrobacteraceae bacterium]